MNGQWHSQHRLDKGASLDERILWHLEHAQSCGCRPIPPKVLEEMQRRGLVFSAED
ncbi:MAG: hypothetical protein ABSG36_03480 [Acidimicrobiales bacterium]